MAKLNLVLQSLPGAHKGDPGYAAAQAVEVMQRFYSNGHVDMGAMNQQLAAMTQVAVGTGGRADPAAYLAFAKQARLGGMLANDQFLYRDLPAVMIALNGSRSGTGDAATYRQFFAGRMTKNAAGKLQELGIIDKGADWKGGQVANMGQHLIGADEFRTNEVQWVRDFLLPQLAKKGVNVNDRASLGQSLASWASTSTGLGFLSELAIGMPGINKESAKIGATTTNPMAVIGKFDPLQKMREFNAAENELMVTLGQLLTGPALSGLKHLTHALQELSDWAKDHPRTAKDILEVSFGLAVMAKALGDIGMVVFLGAPVVRGFAALATSIAEFAPGGAAAAGLSAITTFAAAVGVPLLLSGDEGPHEPKTKAQIAKDQADYLKQYPNYHFPPGTHVVLPIKATLKIDGQTRQVSGVAHGVTGHDPTMGAYPAGAPSGSGN